MKPLIFDYQVSRTEHSVEIKYRYDETLSLNVLDIDGVAKPFIDIDASDVEFMTKTRVRQENDDDGFNFAELMTKTKVSGERSDLHDLFLELKTKTFTIAEKDD